MPGEHDKHFGPEAKQKLAVMLKQIAAKLEQDDTELIGYGRGKAVFTDRKTSHVVFSNGGTNCVIQYSFEDFRTTRNP